MASLGILVFLVVVLVEVLTAAADRFVNGGTPRVFPEGIALMAVTLIVNLFVVVVRAARRPPPEQRGAAGGREAHAQRRADDRRRARRAARRVVGLSAARPDGGAARGGLHRPRVLEHRAGGVAHPGRRDRHRRSATCATVVQSCPASSAARRSARAARPTTRSWICTSGWTATRRCRDGPRHVARRQGPADGEVSAAGRTSSSTSSRLL